MWASTPRPLIKRIFSEFHTSNIQRAQIKRLVLCIVRLGNPIGRPPEGRSLRGAPSVNGTQNRNAFSARKRYFASPSSLFCILFSDKPEKSMPPEARSLPRKESVIESLQRKPSVKMFSSKNPSASCFSTDASACAAPWTRSGGCVRA